MFSLRKQAVQPGPIKPITTARVVTMIARMRALSASDPDLRRLLEELAPYLPADQATAN